MTRVHAHRGAPAERPENTLPSFVRALELGVDGLETDLHLTADGHVVVSHDATLTRACGVPLLIRTATLADVRACDAGWCYVAPDGSRPWLGRGLRVPTLDELLDVIGTTPLNIDIKPRGPAPVARVLEVLQRRRCEDQVLVASFHTTTLREVRRTWRGRTCLGPDEVLRLLTTPRPLLPALRPSGDAAQVPLRLGPLRLDTSSFVDACRACSIRVDYWTVNDPAEARTLVALGADGVMTDDPAAIVPAVRAARAARGG